MSEEQATQWPKVALGSLLLDIQPGYASGVHNSSGNGLPHFRPMNVSSAGRIDRTVLKFVDPASGRSDLRLRSGDVLFNNTNSPELVGKTALFEDNDEPAFSNHMTRLRVDPSRLDPGFLALRLQQTWREGWFAAHCNNHVSQASIGRNVLHTLQIELPPLEVQRAIASLAYDVDCRVTSNAEHLGVARRAIAIFRRAILAAACSGQLTVGGHNHSETSFPDMEIGKLISHLDQGWSPQCESHPSYTESTWGVIKTTAVQPMLFAANENNSSFR